MANQSSIKNKFIWVISTQIINKLGRFILIPLIAKQYGPIQFGIWAQIGVTVEILSIFAGLELKSSFPLFISGKLKKDQQENFWSSFFVGIAFSSFVAIVVSLYSDTLAAKFFGGSHNAIYLKLGCMLMIINIANNFMSSFFQVNLYLRFSLLIVLVELLCSASLYVIASVMPANFTEIIYLTICIRIVIFAIQTIYLLTKLGLIKPRFINVLAILKYSLPLVPVMALHWINNSSDRYLLSYLGKFDGIGSYALGYTIGFFPIGFIFAPFFYLTPGVVFKYWNQGEQEKALQTLGQFMRYAVTIALFTLGIIFLLRKFIIITISTKAFMNASDVVLPISLAYLFLYIGDYYMTTLTLLKKTHLFPFIYLAPALLNIALNFLWIPRWGIIGAAYATLFAMVTLAALDFIVSRMCIEAKFPLIRIMTAFFLAALGLFVSHLLLHQTISSNMLSVAVFSVVYIGGCIIFKVFTIDEVRNVVWKRSEKMALT